MNSKLNYDVYRNVMAYPMRRGVAGFESGLVKGNTCINDSLLFRDYSQIVFPPNNFAEPGSVVEGASIFGGYLFKIYGHFLLESLSRLYVCRLFPNIPIIWLHGTCLKPWQSEILSFLGIKNKHIFINQVTRLDEVVVAQPGYIIQNIFFQEYSDFLGVYASKFINPQKKIWLSRSALPDEAGRYINEVRLEAELQRRGWKIFHPQKHSVIDQLNMLTDAARIAGTEGSAFHTLVLFDTVKSKIDIFSRCRGPKINQNYLTIASRKKINQTVHYPEKILMGDFQGAKSNYLLKSIAEVVNALQSSEAS